MRAMPDSGGSSDRQHPSRERRPSQRAYGYDAHEVLRSPKAVPAPRGSHAARLLPAATSGPAAKTRYASPDAAGEAAPQPAQNGPAAARIPDGANAAVLPSARPRAAAQQQQPAAVLPPPQPGAAAPSAPVQQAEPAAVSNLKPAVPARPPGGTRSIWPFPQPKKRRRTGMMVQEVGNDSSNRCCHHLLPACCHTVMTILNTVHLSPRRFPCTSTSTSGIWRGRCKCRTAKTTRACCRPAPL